MRILVTGGAGFIGSALVRRLIETTDYDIAILDKLTYAGNRSSLGETLLSERLRFIEADICDAAAVAESIRVVNPTIITHLAAESHVDRSIDGPGAFVQTNLVGTYVMLEAATKYWKGLGDTGKADFRFHHISTDEVFGSLGEEGYFTEETPYDPRSPYSASKAGSDHLVRAWGHTYGLPVLVTNCSNNYGPYHYPEKLIPLVILRAITGEPLPVYGDGSNVRDWLFVEDHASALQTVFENGAPGETYAIGGNAERRNIDVVRSICVTLDQRRPLGTGRSYADQIVYVTDRPGHDHRYAIDASKIQEQLGWRPTVSFDEGIGRTVDWYLQNEDWWRKILLRADATRRVGSPG